ncbi:valine--tRNA ligase, mitochondrial isoform X2 [Carcharodon carcharias]|uniref:valine--tRNA ligase, mitochondrial isoform X2 n=1 Tax=Carcharodon carcharias TaxID=13397 RepID=UPI001B7E236E|nr:valine--tRNA ligase, mitochondrial isoform X2 [Carcharodon carcharias]
MFLRCWWGEVGLQVRLRPGASAWISNGAPSHVRDRVGKERRQRRRVEEIEARSGSGEGRAEQPWLEPEVITYSVPTPPGEKKDTSVPLPDSYSPQYVEAAWYPWWERQGFFKPEYHERLPHREDSTFSLCIPPPNVTGSLHLGHALTVAIQDAVVRWRRMQGWKVLWVPGCDHAGIATQVVVEKQLWREQGLRRQDLTRAAFLKEVWRWKEEKGGEIYHQLRRLGSSLDWDRARFTMDAVESRELSGRSYISIPGYQDKVAFGELVHFAYLTEDSGEEVVVATTRPETMLGDVAVVVHPGDGRYTHLVGKQLRHPFTGRLLPVLADTLVDREFGTGAVKVTPAHDYTDYELSLKHQLPLISIFNENGTMATESGDWLEGVKRFDARERVLAALSERGLYRGLKEHPMVLRLCSRSGDVVEPLLKSQWYVQCRELAEEAMAALDRGQLSFTPPSLQKTWHSWLANISDWCISRQLWWGHRIPAYRVTFPGSRDLEGETEELWVIGRNQEEARRNAAKQHGIEESEIALTQDEDVLDTWFSSALFPFAAMGWPRERADLRNFYPNSLLETGSDLIFFWVARMVMLGQQLMGELPFRQVLFHSMVRDSHGRKMSKSLGNVIDPLDVINGISMLRLHKKLQEGNLDPRESRIAQEGQKRDFPRGIPECGTDALRFSLSSYKCQGEDINLDIATFLSSRRFCNKIWNTMKFTFSALPENFQPWPTDMVHPAAAIDRWILSRLLHTIAACDQGFQEYNLQAVTSAIHRFWLHDLCDVYLECVKPVLRSGERSPLESVQQILYLSTERALCLLSPFMPYLTEELWQRLPSHHQHRQPSICVTRYPSVSELPDWHYPQEESDFLFVQEVVRVVRAVRADYQLTKARPELYISCDEDVGGRLGPFLGPLQTLSRSGSVELLTPGGDAPVGCTIAVVNQHCQVHLLLKGLIDPQKELEKLSARQQRIGAQLSTAISRTQIPGYEEKVPERIREENAQKVCSLQAELERVTQAIRGFEKPPDKPR